MISQAVSVRQVILYEGPETTPFAPADRLSLVQGLLQRGFATSVRHAFDSLRGLHQQHVIVLGRFGAEAPASLLPESSDRQVQVHNVTDCSVDDALDWVEQNCDASGHSKAHQWKPWFPVIDFDRCTNCMQCLSFCLFDVYGVTANGQITVQNEDNCKTDCPACSRVCPEVAILFPKYKAGPINGDEVSADDVRREAMKVDISSLLGGDIYSMLRDRSEKAKSRFSKERDDDRALKERQRCLKKLQEGADLDVPSDILASLPSLDEIQKKAALAKEKARLAIEQNQNATSRTPPPGADE